MDELQLSSRTYARSKPARVSTYARIPKPNPITGQSDRSTRPRLSSLGLWLITIAYAHWLMVERKPKVWPFGHEFVSTMWIIGVGKTHKIPWNSVLHAFGCLCGLLLAGLEASKHHSCAPLNYRPLSYGPPEFCPMLRQALPF
jgi:hypothetical protein